MPKAARASYPIRSKTQRVALPARHEPYWSRLAQGTYVGFRKLATGEGTWIARWRDEDGKQHYRRLGHFETFDAAAKAAVRWAEQNEQGASPTVTTVEAACVAYVAALRAGGRKATAEDAEGRFRRLVYGTRFGRIELDRLKSDAVERWRDAQLPEDEDGETQRKARDTINRNLATLKAALNRALKSRLVATDAGWKTVGKFEKAGAPRRNAYLTLAERKTLLEHCAPDLALLIQAMLLTGARPGELAALRACDFDKKQGHLMIPAGKTGHRTGLLSKPAIAFFTEQVKGRIGKAPMLSQADGSRWHRDAWKKPMREAVRKAGLRDGVVLYSLRHSAITEMLLAGMDSLLVAKLTGTSVQMIETNYGHVLQKRVAGLLDGVKQI